MAQTLHLFFIRHKSTPFGSHDHSSTLGGVTLPIQHTWGSHMTNSKRLWCHVMNIAHVTSHATNTAAVLRFVFINRQYLQRTFVDASIRSSLALDSKRLRLPRFDGYFRDVNSHGSSVSLTKSTLLSRSHEQHCKTHEK